MSQIPQIVVESLTAFVVCLIAASIIEWLDGGR